MPSGECLWSVSLASVSGQCLWQGTKRQLVRRSDIRDMAVFEPHCSGAGGALRIIPSHGLRFAAPFFMGCQQLICVGLQSLQVCN
jgi:hypothetical protein